MLDRLATKPIAAVDFVTGALRMLDERSRKPASATHQTLAVTLAAQ